MTNISSIDKKKYSKQHTKFRSKLLPSSGETSNTKTQLTKNTTHSCTGYIYVQETKTNISKNINTKYTNPKNIKDDGIKI
jgi:hypothetical protein